MKPLTIEELKALEIGDWIWLVNLYTNHGQYVQIGYGEQGCVLEGKNYGVVPDFRTYGEYWLAYKNKEQAEAKVEIVESKSRLSSVATNEELLDKALDIAIMEQIKEYDGIMGIIMFHGLRNGYLIDAEAWLKELQEKNK